jgi:hypothetical protein
VFTGGDQGAAGSRGGGGGGSRITTGENSGRGGRSCQAEAELTSNRGLVLRREWQRGWRGEVAGLPKESGGFHKKKERRAEAETTESKAAGANAEEVFRDELRRQQKNTPTTSKKKRREYISIQIIVSEH